MYYVLSIMYYVLCIMYYILCIIYYVLYIIYYVLCIMYYVYLCTPRARPFRYAAARGNGTGSPLRAAAPLSMSGPAVSRQLACWTWVSSHGVRTRGTGGAGSSSLSPAHNCVSPPSLSDPTFFPAHLQYPCALIGTSSRTRPAARRRLVVAARAQQATRPLGVATPELWNHESTCQGYRRSSQKESHYLALQSNRAPAQALT